MGASLQEEAQHVVESANHLRDLAACMRECILSAPDDSVMPEDQWNRLVSGWRAPSAIGRAVLRALVSGQSFAVTAQAVTVTTSMTLSEYSTAAYEHPWRKIGAEPAARRLESILLRQAQLPQAQALFKEFGLDQFHGSSRSPQQLLEDARLALDRPSGSEVSPVPVLIPLRESIHALLAALLRRRTTQEPASHDRDKVISVGNQFGRTDLPSDHFTRLGDDVEALGNVPP